MITTYRLNHPVNSNYKLFRVNTAKNMVTITHFEYYLGPESQPEQTVTITRARELWKMYKNQGWV